MLHKLSLIGILYSLIVVGALHFLKPDYYPLTRYVSEYAIGEFGVLAATAFSVYGVSIIISDLFLQKSYLHMFFRKLPFLLLSGLWLVLFILWVENNE